MFSGILGGLGTAFFGPIGGAIGGAVGGLFDADRAEEGVRDQNNANAQQAAQTNAFNAEQAVLNRSFQASQSDLSRSFNSFEADKNRDWLERISGSSWQRGVADMRAAGLNPMLAFSQGGASTPGSGAASSSSPSGSSASGISARFENSKAAGLEQQIVLARLANENKLADSSAALNLATARKAEAETVNVPTTGANVAAQTRVFNESLREIDARIENLRQDTHSKLASENLTEAQRLLVNIERLVKTGELDIQQADLILKKLGAKLMELEVPGAENEAASQGTWWKRNVAPFLPDFLKGASGAGSVRGLLK